MQLHTLGSRTLRNLLLGSVLAGSLGTALADKADFLGRWALTIPGGGAGWLEVKNMNGWYDGSVLWGGGSVLPVASVFFVDDNGEMIYVTRTREVKRKDAAGKVIRTQMFTEALVGKVEGDTINFMQFNPHDDGNGLSQTEFSGKRIPDVPPAPDLSKVKFGTPIPLLNGKDLTGWRLVEAGSANGWSLQDGVLINRPVQEDGKPHKNYGNLRTEKEFEDVNLKLDVKVPKNGNSGVYLRGIYEVQVADTHGRALDSHNMGGLYSRITPTVAAEKPAGEWQHMDITLVDRHLTVILNDKKIIDNQPVMGCTGGALWSDEFRPGPIYLQGDHEAVEYKNVILTPVVK